MQTRTPWTEDQFQEWWGAQEQLRELLQTFKKTQELARKEWAVQYCRDEKRDSRDAVVGYDASIQLIDSLLSMEFSNVEETYKQLKELRDAS